MPSIVAIHQPNFFPWAGYFDKIARADTFILLDDVQYPKTGGSWSNRVKILMSAEGRWLTAPVERNYSGLRTIRQMRFSPAPWRAEILRVLENAYRKAAHAEEAFALLIPLLMHEEDDVAAYNIHAIRTLAARFGLTTPLRISSEIPVEGSATARLIALTKAVGGDIYMCGGGADGYQQDEAFAAAGLTLQYQNFSPTPYPQGEAFVAGLSVIDMLMHLGVDATGARIRGDA